MPQICPKCNYVRQSSDTCPEWQCPACQVAYSKAGGDPAPAGFGRYGKSAASAVQPAGRASRGMSGILLTLAVLGAAAWFGKSALQHRHAQAQAQIATRNIAQPEVILYGTSWCGYCAAARSLFEQNGIRYTELDIEKTTAGYEGHKKLGGGGVPLIVVGGEVMHGYNEGALREILAPWIKS
jgi:glutaredoxin